MNYIADQVARWASTAECPPIAADLVPGTTLAERIALAALGGVVREVVSSVPDDWPEALHQWIKDAPPAPLELIESIRTSPNSGSEALVALAYERIVAGRNRRRLGTFFTPASVVDLMLDRAEAVLPAPSQVVDPGAGVGAFSLAARRRWPEASVVAIDINVVTLGLLATQAVLEEVSDGLTLVHADYLVWLENMSQPDNPVLFLGNPPYTRHQDIDRKSKTSAMSAAAGLVDSGLAGLAAYFLAASLSTMRPQDALCFVLPGSWTEATYGRRLREWLWTQSRRSVELLAFPTKIDVFPGTRVTTVVLIVGPAEDDGAPLTIESLELCEEQIETRQSARHPRSGAAPNTFGPLLWPRDVPQAETVPLSEIADVHRGVATGANHFFFLTDQDRLGIPPELITRGVRRLRHVSGDLLDTEEHDRIGKAGHPRWLLTMRGPEDTDSPAIQQLLAEGVDSGYHDRYLTRSRDHWYAVETIQAPHIVVSLMSKDRFRAVLNTCSAIPSNSMYGIYLKDPASSQGLCKWLNSDAGQSALKAKARHYSGGLLKLEPRDYLEIEVPREFLREEAHRSSPPI